MKNFLSNMKTAMNKAQISFMLRTAGVSTAKEEGSHLLEVLGTIIIAIVILVIFKDNIVNIFTNAMGKTTTQLDNLFN